MNNLGLTVLELQRYGYPITSIDAIRDPMHRKMLVTIRVNAQMPYSKVRRVQDMLMDWYKEGLEFTWVGLEKSAKPVSKPMKRAWVKWGVI